MAADARFRIDADASGFFSTMRRVSGTARDSGDKMTADFRRAAGAIAGALGVGAFTAFVREAATAADEVGKLSARIGVDTKALAGWRLAAAEAGVEFRTLTTSFQAAQIRIGQAAAGTGEGAKWMRALGLEAKALAALAPDQAVLEVAAALEKIESPAQRAAASAAILGEQARDLGPLLKDGAAKVREATAAAEGFGVALSRVETAQIEIANDALGRMKLAAQGVATQIALKLSPYIIELADHFTRLASEGRGFGEQIAVGVRVAFGALQVLANGINAIDAAVSGFLGALAGGTAIWAERFGFDKAATFLDSARQVAIERTRTALEDIKSWEQIASDADAIIARAEAAAAAAAASTATGPGAAGTDLLGGQEFDQAAFDKWSRQQADLAERKREQLNEQLFKETEVYERHYANLAEIQASTERRLAMERVAAEDEANRAILALRAGAVGQIGNLLRVMGTKHKAAAKAAIALEKAQALFQVFVNTKAAAVKALAVYGPTPVGFAAAAAAIAFGALQAAAIVGQGISEAQQTGSAPVGSAANPAFTREQYGDNGGDRPPPGASGGSAIQVVVTGNVGFTPDIIDQIVEGIREATDGRDVVLFSPDSRQALELGG